MSNKSASGQLYINEFCASNATVIYDSTYNDFSDWVEIYNAGNFDINLNGYYITDNLDNPDKFQITVDTILASKSFIIIWTDDRGLDLHPGFKLSQDGEEIGLFAPDLTLVDSLTFDYQQVDVSYGRTSDGSEGWSYFYNPTPGSSNITTPYSGFVYHVPQFSVHGGFFNSPQKIELSSLMGGIIHYTLDGSEPTLNSPEYTTPINIESTTVIRASIFETGLIPGRIITHTYFINEDFEDRKLPVISIVTDPENFWGSTKGIYVQDFKPDWEVPVNIEMFENNGSDRAVFNMPAGTKINGLHSWQLPQKMLGIYFRKQYGATKLEYPLFLSKTRTNITDFALRASGSDWSYTLFRDKLGQSAARENMDVDIMDYRSCIVYVNGEYLGIHNIREKVNKDYIVGNYGLNSDSFDMVENEDFAEQGNLDAYKSFMSLYKKDLSAQSNYDTVAATMNIENFTDYVITQMAVGNSSISHNVMCWKPKDYGKWRWIMMDLDRGYFSPSSRMIDFYVNQTVYPFKSLMKNEGYVKYFGQKLADHLYTTFHPTQIKKLIDKHQKTIEAEIDRQVTRWLGTTSSYGDAIPSVAYWYNEVDNLRSYAEVRPQLLLDDLTNYGFEKSENLSLYVIPSNAGFLKLNGLKVPGTSWSAPYPLDLNIKLSAYNKPGFEFKGWLVPEDTILIPQTSVWKYLDDGTDPGTQWKDLNFDDNSWSSGQGELGYGDGDENTTLSYGGNSQNKYITYYFRKKFELPASGFEALSYILNIKRDDGAIVYVNGQEVIRTNMPDGIITNTTLASSAIGGSEESAFNSYPLDSTLFQSGMNIIAVEVHQGNVTSSDISFDLELVAQYLDNMNYTSVNPEYEFTHSQPNSIMAVYEQSSDCLLPDTISNDMTLDKNCSPYLAQGDVIIEEGITVSISEGVEIHMPEDANFIIHGKLIAAGNSDEPVIFKLNPQYKGSSWGAVNFVDSPDTSYLSHVIIQDASFGPAITHAVAAISLYNAKVRIDNLTIDSVYGNPITARYSWLDIRDSKLHSEITGDLINAKYGKTFVLNCDLEGNKMPDTDGIDYDDIEDGVISNCRINGFFGFNSDAIDIGEQATNIRIDSNFIYNITDKGVSVGQHSSATVRNTTFVNCNLGLGLKDSCEVTVDHCTFYNVGIPVSCYEKNLGSTGGNGKVTNSILSNSIDKTYFFDNKSTLIISHSIADNDSLPVNYNNYFGDPKFENPVEFNFRLKTESPAKAGLEGADYMGSHYFNFSETPEIMISGIYYFNKGIDDKSEFIMLYNPSAGNIDISGYTLSEAVEYTFPVNTIINAHDTLFITKDLLAPPAYYYPDNALEWDKGNLANEGESILLKNSHGIVVDKVHYLSNAPWPVIDDAESILMLNSYTVDNHFGENWHVYKYTDIISAQSDTESLEISVYPNPVSDFVNIEAYMYKNNAVTIIDLSGKILDYAQLNEFGFGRINFSRFENGIYFLRIGNKSVKVLVFH